MLKIGSKIKSIRVGNKLTQDEFAELLGAKKQSVSQWETDKSYPELDKIQRIVDIFKVSYEYLFGTLSLEDAVQKVEEPVGQYKTDDLRLYKIIDQNDVVIRNQISVIEVLKNVIEKCLETKKL